ncbi:MAG: hypothetical protein ACREBR_03955 [bacterium]
MPVDNASRKATQQAEGQKQTTNSAILVINNNRSEHKESSSTVLTTVENRLVLTGNQRYILPSWHISEPDQGFNDFIEQMFLTNQLYVSLR